jgi:energy-coupling factor transporter transmembrane protein EcfT
MTVSESLVIPICRSEQHTTATTTGRDPRLHLLLALAGSIALLLNSQLLFQFISFHFLLVLLLWWGMSLTTLLKSIWPILIMMSITVCYHLLFAQVSGGDYGSRPILYSPKLDSGLFYAFRLGGLYLLILQLAKLVTTDRLADSFLVFLKTLRPLQKVGFPIVQTALAIRAGLSSIPAITKSMQDMEESQRFFYKEESPRPHHRLSLSARIRRFMQLIFPLLVIVIRRADHLTHAIRARGYYPATVINLQFDLRWQGRDTIESLLIVSAFILLWRLTA